MTPDNPAPLPAPSRAPSIVVGLLLGAFVGFFAAALLVGVGGYAFVKRKEREVRLGWNLVPVVVASQDIPEDTVVTFDMLSQRSVPEQFVTSSVVRPDSANYIVNQKVLVSVQTGDPLLWSQFETKRKPEMLVAARDVPAGGKLAVEDLAEQPWPEDLVTASYVPARDRPQAVGRHVFAPFRQGDPILWTHLQADPGPVAITPASGKK